MAVFATFTNVAKYPSKISALGEMADTSERLRQVKIINNPRTRLVKIRLISTVTLHYFIGFIISFSVWFLL